ncbi:MAG: hypothetical protein NTX17_00370 [Candidatus Eisenbacteria bacterium]|nr:hypothetical protein [Candidatus Eisenbacteria bacterium]
MKILLPKLRSQKGAAVVGCALVASTLFAIVVTPPWFSGAWVLLGVLAASRVLVKDIQVKVPFEGFPSKGTLVTVDVAIGSRTSFGNLFPKLSGLPLRAACTMRREI